MLYLALFLLANGLLCHGAYRLGSRHDLWALLLAPPLVVVAWYVVLRFNLTPVPGATVGSAIMATAAWYAGGLCVLVAVALLVASWRARRSVIVAALSLGVIAPALLALGFRVKTAGRADDAPRGGPVAAPPTARDSLAEGYAWAVDNGIDSDAGCSIGGASFVAGCRKAVHRGGQ